MRFGHGADVVRRKPAVKVEFNDGIRFAGQPMARFHFGGAAQKWVFGANEQDHLVESIVIANPQLDGCTLRPERIFG